MKAVHPNVADQFILRLASERRLGGVGRPLSAIQDILVNDGGLDRDLVNDRLEVLLDRKLIEPLYTTPGRRPLDDRGMVFRITTQGKDHLNRLEVTTQFNVRLPETLAVELGKLAESRGETSSAMAIRGLEEWTRMEKYPGIDFRWTPTGRRPHLTGTGLTIWEFYRMWLAHGEDMDKLQKNFPDLKASQIRGGVAYAKAHLYEMPEGAWGKRPPFATEVKV